MKGMLTENQKDDTIQIEEAEKQISLEVPNFDESIRDDFEEGTVEKMITQKATRPWSLK